MTDKNTAILVDPSKCYTMRQARVVPHRQSDIDRIAEDFKKGRQETPCSTYEADEDGRYCIYHGEGRLKAALQAKTKLWIIPNKGKVPAEATSETLIRQARDNIDKSGFTPFDIAATIKALLNDKNRKLRKKDIAGEFNRPPNWVTKHLNLIDSPQELIDLYITGTCEDLEALQMLNRINHSSHDVFLKTLKSKLIKRPELQKILTNIKEGLDPFESKEQSYTEKPIETICPNLPNGCAAIAQALHSNARWKWGYILKFPHEEMETVIDKSVDVYEQDAFKDYNKAQRHALQELRAAILDLCNDTTQGFYKTTLDWVNSILGIHQDSEPSLTTPSREVQLELDALSKHDEEDKALSNTKKDNELTTNTEQRPPSQVKAIKERSHQLISINDYDIAQRTELTEGAMIVGNVFAEERFLYSAIALAPSRTDNNQLKILTLPKEEHCEVHKDQFIATHLKVGSVLIEL
ncbi:KorB domain-containing protein [Vibrio harveyi]|uniref:KorB domain-containing protein n=1 Tax=Vibrio harveyi TaxID=669 RepID=UPI003BB69424